MVDRATPAVDRLTPLERDILQGFANGLTTREVADLGGMAFNTVRVHRQRILTKLHVHTITEAVAVAYRAEKIA